PSRGAFMRNHRIALLPSSAQARGGVWWRLSIRYSAEAETSPRVAKYSAVLVNCAGLPVAQLPPKKKTIAGRRSALFQPDGKKRLIFRSPGGVVLYTSTALLPMGRKSVPIGFRAAGMQLTTLKNASPTRITCILPS